MASSRLDFLFCHLCGTLLTVPSTEYAQCPLCKTHRDMQDVCDKEISFTIHDEDIRRELGMEIIEEHTVCKKCGKCGHGKATYYTRQMRSADEGQPTFYTCIGCGHQSQEN
ncbi:DNA-directed RNA polymerase I subunit RPA12 [Glycine soja]